MWLHSREYIACLAQCTQYHYGWVPYGQANVASYQHLIQIASCSFNEVALQLEGVCLSDWNNNSGICVCEHMYTFQCNICKLMLVGQQIFRILECLFFPYCTFSRFRLKIHGTTFVYYFFLLCDTSTRDSDKTIWVCSRGENEAWARR